MSNGTNMSSNANKDVVYLDVDEEITGVIDKVRGSEHKIVALVLPKRAGVFQSIVNMRLLKHTADNAKKHVVLITSEAGILPLAGTVGLHVARNLQSRPEIPIAPAAPDNDIEEADESMAMDDAPAKGDVPVDKSQSVGDLASSAAAKTAMDDDDAIELDNSDVTPPVSAADKKAKGKKNKKLKVPNFNKFRLWLILGGVILALLIVILYICLTVLPKATVTVKTDSVAVASNVGVSLDTAADSVDPSTGDVPATSVQTQKVQTQQVDSSGQRNDGTKASGSVTMTAGPCTGDAPSDLPEGTGISANGQTFLTQGDVTFTPSLSGGKCTFVSTNSTDVVAQNAGAAGNVGATSFTVAGSSNVSAKSDSPMSGGTDKITKIVAQSDIDSAKQKIGSQDTSAIKQQLQSSLQSKGLYAIPATLSPGTPVITANANVGDAADNVTVTESDLQKLIAASVDKQIDPKKQTILDYGLDKANFTVQSQRASGALVAMQTNSIAGSSLNTDALKPQIAGKKAGDAENLIKADPGVTDVTVHYSPFWVSSIPKKTSRITIQIEKPKTSNAQS